MEEQVVRDYYELVRRNSDHWKQSHVIDHGIKRMISQSVIADALLRGGYYSDPEDARKRVNRHLRSDPPSRRTARGIVTDEDVRRYLSLGQFS